MDLEKAEKPQNLPQNEQWQDISYHNQYNLNGLSLRWMGISK
jgi:hypothetical protein